MVHLGVRWAMWLETVLFYVYVDHSVVPKHMIMVLIMKLHVNGVEFDKRRFLFLK